VGVISNQEYAERAWENARLRKRLVGVFFAFHYGQLVVCGNFVFLDRIQEADET
jgi:hypothetical protein